MTDTVQSLLRPLEQAILQSFDKIDLPSSSPCHIAIAYSGGVDSSVLLHLLARIQKQTHYVLHAFHIHHGLSVHADEWLNHCQQVANELHIPFVAQQVQLSAVADVGVEDAARTARYHALDKLCKEHHIQSLFMAHHQDDQIETLLLHLCRGTGLNGLVGMETVMKSTLLPQSQVSVIRPFLSITKQQIQQVAQSLHIVHIEDESNQDIRYTRNTLRHEVIPVLKRYFPHIDQSFLRLSAHAESAQRILSEVAATDAETMIRQHQLNLKEMQPLSIDRRMNLLQYWLSLHDCRVASTSWLNELYHQLFESKEDAQICVSLGNASIRRYEGHAYYVTHASIRPLPDKPQAFEWRGETEIVFPEFGGKLLFRQVDQGMSADWLKSQSLLLTQRTGGEVLKLDARRPIKTLKVWCQERHIPAWRRSILPLVKTTENHLLFAAELGSNLLNTPISTDKAIQIQWQSTE